MITFPVTVAVPAEIPFTVIVYPLRLTVATPVLPEVAVPPVTVPFWTFVTVAVIVPCDPTGIGAGIDKVTLHDGLGVGVGGGVGAGVHVKSGPYVAALQ